MRKEVTFGFTLLAAAVAVALLAAPSASQSASSETFEIDPVHTSALFRVMHLGVAPVYGRFNGIEGSFTLVEGGKGAVEVGIDAKSVDTGNAKRDDHLRGPDFFSVAQFPEIRFEGTVEHVSGKEYRAEGTFTLHGVSKPLTVKLERFGTANAMGGKRTGFECTFTIERSEFGMNWRPDLLGDEVKVILGVEGLDKEE